MDEEEELELLIMEWLEAEEEAARARAATIKTILRVIRTDAPDHDG